MTKDEAIAIIRKEYLCVDRDCDIERSCGKCDLMMPSKEPILEAYEMAIKALEQQTCEDAVSREDVLMALTGEWTESTDELIHGFIKRIKALPSVNPQPKWIPVSEGLPEDGRPVLIYAWNVHHVVARYDSFRTENGYKKCWVTADAWNGNTEIKHDVTAWMPLPQPYEPQESEVSE